MLAALLVALILLAVTGFAFVDILRGPEDVNAAADLEKGDYVVVDIFADLGCYAEAFRGEDKITGLYILVPMEDQLVSFLVPERYFDAEFRIRQSTLMWLNGFSDSLSEYILTVGTVRTLSEKEQTLLYDWFGENHIWMTETGILGPVEDYSVYLSPYVICVDQLGHLPAVWVYILSGAAWLLIMLAVVLGLLWALGKFDPKPEAVPETAEAHDEAPECPEEEAAPAEAAAPELPEETPETTENENGTL